MNPIIKVTNIKGEDLYLNVNHIVLLQKKNNGCQINYHGGYYAIIAEDIDLLLTEIEKATMPRKCYSIEYPNDIYKFHKFIELGNNVKALVENEDGMLKMLYYHEVVFIYG